MCGSRSSWLLTLQGVTGPPLHAMQLLVLTSDKPQASLGVRLLRDLQIVFGPNDMVRSEDIITCVNGAVRSHRGSGSTPDGSPAGLP